MAGPLSWYKMALSGVMAADDKRKSTIDLLHKLVDWSVVVPPAAYDVAQPVFFGAAAQDYLCPPALQSALTSKHCRGLTDKSRKTYDGDHWIIFSHADEINRDLLEWIESLDLSV
jgi:soluble epoxide hydrolase/lipid-phosphate phosphatase